MSWGILGENYELSPVKGSSAAWRVTCAITYKQQNVFFLVGLREHFRHAVIACTLIEEGGKGRSRAIKREKKKKICLQHCVAFQIMFSYTAPVLNTTTEFQANVIKRNSAASIAVENLTSCAMAYIVGGSVTAFYKVIFLGVGTLFFLVCKVCYGKIRSDGDKFQDEIFSLRMKAQILEHRKVLKMSCTIYVQAFPWF